MLTRLYETIDALIDFAFRHLELDAANGDWVRNQIFAIFGLDSYQPTGTTPDPAADVETLVGEYTQAAVDAGVLAEENVAAVADQTMAILSLNPAQLQARFEQIREADGPTAAMDWFFEYCTHNYYVRKAQLDRNPRFDVDDLIVTINLAKPEFRSTASAKAGNAVSGGYPACTICHENEGFAGRVKYSLRTIPVTLGGQPWFWQYSPYGYFHQHGIAVNYEHTPMHVDRGTFTRLMDFVDQFPDFFLGCNAALPRIGGSVLSHDHYQGGRGPLPMQEATAWKTFVLEEFPQAQVEILDWYNTVVRVVSKDRVAVEEISDRISKAWCRYRNEELGIVPSAGDDVFSAVSPTAVITERGYEMSIIFRSNITSEEFPEGIFHAHPEFHAIKQESIGLIEAQGLFILPARLVRQLGEIEKILADDTEARAAGVVSADGLLTGELEEFNMVFAELRERVAGSHDPEAIAAAVREELGSVCARILDNTAVFQDKNQTVDFLVELGFTEQI